MTSEGTDALILAFTSETGQSVADYTHRIFLFGFFNQREDIFTHFIGGECISWTKSTWTIGLGPVQVIISWTKLVYSLD